MTAVIPDVNDIAESTPAEDESLWERRMRTLTMRNAGATYKQIAEKMGISTTQVRKDIRLAYREVIAETAEDMIARQRSILFDIQRANYSAAVGGDIDAQKAILSTLDHEAKLFGLYAPTRVNVGVSDVEFAEKAATLINSLGLEPPKELVNAIRNRPEDIDGEVVDVPVVEPAPAASGPVAAEDWSNI